METKTCLVCKINQIPWRLQAGTDKPESSKRYRARQHCDDECLQVLSYQKKWIRIYNDWARDIEMAESRRVQAAFIHNDTKSLAFWNIVKSITPASSQFGAL